MPATRLEISNVLEDPDQPGRITFTVRAVDDAGAPARDYTGAIFFSSSDPAANLPDSYIFSVADAREHIFVAEFPNGDDIEFRVEDAADPSLSAAFSGDAPCYCTGTLILTVGGEVAVEALAVGDVVITASGERRPICWIGRRTVDCRTARRPAEIRPVRMSAGALAPGLPRRDLLVSPGHAVFFDDVLVPAKSLINDSTVQQVEAGVVTYYGIELDSHDMIFAEGVAAESYFDDGQRDRFDNYAGDRTDLDRTRASIRAGSYRPLHVDGPRVGAIRAWIDARARRLGRPAFYGLPEVEASDGTAAVGVKGHVDVATRERAEGWAWCPDRTDEPVLLELVLDGEVRAVFAADMHRPDLAFTGSRRHAFRLRLPPEAHGAGWASIRVRVRGTGQHLPNSPLLLASAPLLAA